MAKSKSIKRRETRKPLRKSVVSKLLIIKNRTSLYRQVEALTSSLDNEEAALAKKKRKLIVALIWEVNSFHIELIAYGGHKV